MSKLSKLDLRKIPAISESPEKRHELFLKNDEMNSSLTSRNHEFISSVSDVNVAMGMPPSDNKTSASLLNDSEDREVLRKSSKDGSLNYTDEVINTATHMAGAVFALFGSLLLIIKSVQAGKWWHVVSFVIYGFTVVALFTMSSLHHGVDGTEKTNRRLRTLDYVAVYGLIAGSIVPLCLVLYRGPLGFAALAVVLIVTAFGVTMRSIYHTLPSYVSLTLYLCLGWLPTLLILLNRGVLPAGGILWLIVGGLFYTIGAMVYAREKPNIIEAKFGFHEIWHIAVLLGALSHFLFMYWYVLPVK